MEGGRYSCEAVIEKERRSGAVHERSFRCEDEDVASRGCSVRAVMWNSGLCSGDERNSKVSIML